MGYQRAEWHSGLTYRQTCEQCHTVVQYQDDKLGFRPWFADGFVYCPTCKKPLRHHEKYAIDGPDRESKPSTAETAATFCTQCGRAFGPSDRFCGGCGAKRT